MRYFDVCFACAVMLQRWSSDFGLTLIPSISEALNNVCRRRNLLFSIHLCCIFVE